MSAGVFAADVDTGTLTIKGNIAESPCKFEAGGDSVSINMPTVPTSVFEGKAKYSTYDDAVGVTSSMLKISCPKEVAGVKLSLITNDKITGNDKAIASSNDTVGYYLYLGDNSDVWMFLHLLTLRVIKQRKVNMLFRLKQNTWNWQITQCNQVMCYLLWLCVWRRINK